MRQKHETATSFNQLKEITQAIQAKKTSAQTSDNANTCEPIQKSTHAKKARLNPTKRAFSERQRTTTKNDSQASAEEIQRGR
ncbi:hypothetical protein ACLGER_02605 [Helicobacter pylori]